VSEDAKDGNYKSLFWNKSSPRISLCSSCLRGSNRFEAITRQFSVLAMPTLLLISRCPPYPLHLGDRLIVWHLAQQLSQRGCEIDLIALTQHTSDAEDIPHYENFFRRVSLLPERPRTPLMFLRRLLIPAARFPKDVKDAWAGDLWQAVENHLAQNHYDNVQLFGGVHVYELANLLQDHAPIITPYESYSLYLRRLLQRENGLRNRLNLWIAQQYERFMFTPYHKVVVLSETDRDELHGLNPALPLEVIPNGIDLDFFTRKNDQQRDAATLLFVGNYEYAPNVDAALLLIQEILPRVRQAVPAARLQLVGNAPPPQLLALASEQVEITGRVPDVRPYLTQATAFVCGDGDSGCGDTSQRGWHFGDAQRKRPGCLSG